MEIFVVAAVALIVFGPQKLPEIARSVGRFMSEIRRMANEVKSEFDAGLDTSEDASPVSDERTDDIEDAATPTAED